MHEQAWLRRLLTLVDRAAADDSKARRGADVLVATDVAAQGLWVDG